MMNLDEARSLFTGLQSKTFLNAACVSLTPNTASTAIAEFMSDLLDSSPKETMDLRAVLAPHKTRAEKEVAKALNVEPHHVALIESTTQGLNIAASTIPFEPQDEVLICDTEYLQVALPFVQMAGKKQLKVVAIQVPLEKDLSSDDIVAKFSKNTKAVCISSVQWCTGQRVFTKKLGEVCRKNKIWLIVDGIQEAGALRCDMNLRDCDFFIAGGHKWLNAPFGCGFMYMSEKALSLEPSQYGYLNLAEPVCGWDEHFQNPALTPFGPYAFPKCANSFCIGAGSNFAGILGLYETMKIVNQLGSSVVEDQVLHLSQLLKSELQKIGAKVIRPYEPQNYSGLTLFRLGETPQNDRQILDCLLQQKIQISIRYSNNHGGLRVSTHYFNNEDDVLRLIYEIKRIF